MKKDTWVIVANSSMARFFKVEKNTTLVEMEALVHPESRLHTQELVDGRPGRTYDSSGGARHSIDPPFSHHQLEFAAFAKELGHHLETARESGKYDRLFIAASPIFLGLLRQAMSNPTLQLIAGEVGKDMTHMKPDEIAQHLPLRF